MPYDWLSIDLLLQLLTISNNTINILNNKTDIKVICHLNSDLYKSLYLKSPKV